MKNYWKLDQQGFIANYAVSGPKQEIFSNDKKDSNQLRYEAYLRSIIADHEPVTDMDDIQIGKKSRLGIDWEYYYNYGSSFVDVSDFYSLLRKITFDAATVLVVPQDMEVNAVVWSYAAVDLYCNGVCAGSIAHPVYKPIQKQEVTLPLKKGENLIYLACQNLGVRDTRSVVGLQIMQRREEIQVTIPDRSCADDIFEAQQFLDTADLQRDRLVFRSPARPGTAYSYRHISPDFADAKIAPVWYDIEGKEEIGLQEGEAFVKVRIKANRAELSRSFERTEQIKPSYPEHEVTFEENKEIIFRRIADVMSLSRGEKFGFPISNILARKHCGISTKDDDRLLEEMLELIEERYDCSDFLMCGLIRYLHNYPVEGRLKERIKEVILNYRYWMDMDGFDGMCFWSENHALMFYTCAMNAGEMYPDEYFPRAKRTGRELFAYGRDKVLQWLDDVERYGFEEFLSTVYMCVTFAALINVVDYSEPEISSRAAAITDKMLSMLSLHTYKNGIIAPMGRVYRNVLYPFDQGAMALMNLINPKLPYSYGEGWLGFWATSSYPVPDGLVHLMEDDAEVTYTTGNARVCLEKNHDYCLTSVQSPREPFIRWENETLKEDADTSTNSYTKSFNERFHGTTCFMPGVYGYQQHMWYAALDGEAAVFVNHPGSTSEDGDMRPGYWHGNGVMPAVKQQHGIIGSIYVIPDVFPLHYTHLYCPECRFDEVRKEENWIFLKKDTGYLAVWCSEPFISYNGRNFHCEQRAYGDEMAWFCYAAHSRDAENMEEFIGIAKALEPVYKKENKTLTAKGFELTYTACHDTTQYL